jgi:hypothetical protein
MSALYRIRVKRLDLEVEVESTDRAYVDARVDQYLNSATSAEPPAAAGRGQSSSKRSSRSPSIGEFVRRINPAKKNEVAATIAYFLEYHAEPIAEEWKPDHVADKFPDVRKPKPANMTDLLVKSNFFMGGREKGSYRLSESGVNWVEAQLGGHED